MGWSEGEGKIARHNRERGINNKTHLNRKSRENVGAETGQILMQEDSSGAAEASFKVLKKPAYPETLHFSV